MSLSLKLGVPVLTITEGLVELALLRTHNLTAESVRISGA